MAERNLMAGEGTLDFITVIESVIKRSCIIDFGIIQNVVSGGVVDVSVAVSTTEQNMYCMTCVLANIASSSLTVDVKPNVGDRVLVIYPRLYDDNMFTVPDKDEDKQKIIVNRQARGYNLCSGIAILINQYKVNSHKNLIKVEDGSLTVQLGYDKDNDKHTLTFSTDADGAVNFANEKASVSIDKDGAVNLNLADEKASVSIDKDGAVNFANDNSTFVIDKDGYLDYKNTHDNKTQLTFTSSGATIQDKNGCKIEMSSSFTTINGKLKVKNG